MAPTTPPAALLPTPLSAYPPPSPDGLFATLAQRAGQDPFNLVATAISCLAIVHTFMVARFSAMAHRVQHRHDETAVREGPTSLENQLARFLNIVPSSAPSREGAVSSARSPSSSRIRRPR